MKKKDVPLKRQKKENQGKVAPLITAIVVKNLFGRYNYSFKFPSVKVNQFPQLTIFYGDNGTGKTTILKLLFHLLSSGQEHGHRTFLSTIPLTLFEVSFSDGRKISIGRKESQLIGTYTLKLTKSKKRQLIALVKFDQSGQVRLPWASDVDKIMEELPELGRSIYFLADDRTLEADDISNHAMPPAQIDVPHSVLARRQLEESDKRSTQSLWEVLERTATWLRRKLIQASSQGEFDSQQIYGRIVESINRHGIPRIRNYEAEQEKILEIINELDGRSWLFARHGLTSRFDAKRFKNALSRAKGKELSAIVHVMSSFVESQEVRLNALQDLHDRIQNFLEIINGLLLHKSVKVRVGEKISIVSDSDLELYPNNLSSGENQLLLLLLNVLISTDTPSLFILDEPEISLNIKWQRQLVDVLLEMTRDSQSQFFLATHSIEILAKHDAYVTKLDPS